MVCILMTGSFQSCEEDVLIMGTPEFIPVVYCLLNPADSVQTVRVSRVFQDHDQLSAWEQKFDRYLADTLKMVYLEQIGDLQEHTIWTFTSYKQIRQSDDSAFTSTYLYTTNFRPDFSSNYKLYVYFPDTRTMVSSSIRTLAKTQLIDPAIVPGRKIVIDPSQGYTVRWSAPMESAYYQGIFHINYLEEESGQITGKTIELPMSIRLAEAALPIVSQTLTGQRFLLTLKEQIPIAAGTRRKLTTLDFTFYSGGPEIALFANSGLNPKGLEGTVVDFSNLDNARGLFSSITSISIKGLRLSDSSIDSLASNSLTKSLNFLSSHEDF